MARYDGPGHLRDVAHAVATSPDGSKVFVTGESTLPGYNEDYATVAYDASTGAKLWLKRYNGAGNSLDQANSIAVSPDGSRVFVTGESVGAGSELTGYGTVAYDATTGATLWVGRYKGPGNGDDSPKSIAVSSDGSEVFVTGYTVGANGGYDYGTVAYDGSTGATLWVERYNGPKNDLDGAWSIAASTDGSKVFVTGVSKGKGSSFDYATVAYDASSGTTAWVSRYNGPANDYDAASSVAASPDGSKVFVTGESAGIGTFSDYATVAYNASTGSKLWAKRYNGPANSSDRAAGLGASPDGSKVFVTGSSPGGEAESDYATLAYDAATGATLWAKRNNARKGQSVDQAHALAVSPDGSKVFVTGESSLNFSEDYATVAYNASTGSKLWVKRYNGPGNVDDDALALSPSPDGSKVFVTGVSNGPHYNEDYATLAYAA